MATVLSNSMNHQQNTPPPSSSMANSGLPVPVLIHHFFAITSSFIWLFSLTVHIFKLHPQTKTSTGTGGGSITELRQYFLLAGLLVLYILHLPFMVLLPMGSRPWITNKDNENWRFYRWFMGLNRPEQLGWTTGFRAAVTLTLTGIPFLFATSASTKWWSVAGILGLAFEGFFVAETVKHTDLEEGWFMAVMANAVFTAHGLFDYRKEAWVVFGICLFLIFVHRFLPKYDDEELLIKYGFEEIVESDEEEDEQVEEDHQAAAAASSGATANNNNQLHVRAAVSAVPNTQLVLMAPPHDHQQQVEIECNAEEIPTFPSRRSDSTESLTSFRSCP